MVIFQGLPLQITGDWSTYLDRISLVEQFDLHLGIYVFLLPIASYISLFNLGKPQIPLRHPPYLEIRIIHPWPIHVDPSYIKVLDMLHKTAVSCNSTILCVKRSKAYLALTSSLSACNKK